MHRTIHCTYEVDIPKLKGCAVERIRLIMPDKKIDIAATTA